MQNQIYQTPEKTPMIVNPQATNYNYPVMGYGYTPQAPQMTQQPQVQYQNYSPATVAAPVKLSYKCNFLEQLQGMYECDKDGKGQPDRINVLMPTWKNQVTPGTDQGCTIVRCVSADGEALPDMMILEETNRFILASIDQEVQAQMVKGVDMKNGLTWTKIDGSNMFWSRVGHVTFNFVRPDTLNRNERTFSNTSMSSVTSNFSQSSPEYVPQVAAQCPQPLQHPYPQQVIPRGSLTQQQLLETLSVAQRRGSLTQQQLLPSLQLANAYSQHSEASSTDSFPSYDHGHREQSSVEEQQELMLLEQIKRLCQHRPRLVKRVVHWGLSRDTEPIAIKMNPELVQKLSKGRIWVCVDKMLPSSKSLTGVPEETSPELDSLDDLKGAYQQAGEEGMYLQPRPEANQPGTQHRLRKGENGFWVIEEFDPNTERWMKRTVEQPGGRWWDIPTQRKIRLKLVPLDSILQRLGGDYSELFSGNIEKQMQFLFLSCNQKKLNTKLKKRNLKHNIANLKVKLEKQHCLSFAVRIANIADSIAKEFGVHPN